MNKHIIFIEMGRSGLNGAFGGSLKSLIQITKSRLRNHFQFTVLLDFPNKHISKLFETDGTRLISRNDNNDFRQEFRLQKSKIPTFIRTSVVYKMLSFVLNRKYINALCHDLERLDADVLHGNDRLSANVKAIAAAKKLNIPYIQHQRKFETRLDPITKYYSKYPAKFIAISEAVKQNLIDVVGVDPERIVLIHNWIDSTPINLKKNYPLSFSKMKLLWVGRILPWKGLHLIFDIMDLWLAEGHINFSFDVFGDFADEGNYSRMIRNKMNEPKYQRHLCFHGFKTFEDIYKGHYDFLIHTSIEPEPFGRTIIEAMINGIPVAATKMGGVSDILSDEVSGLLYDPNSLNTIASRIRILFSDKHRYNEVRKNAMEKVRLQFSGTQQIGALETLYSTLD